MIDPQVAWDKLAQFQTPEQLRQFFQDEGIKGIVGHAAKCPIATWMQQTTQVRQVTVAGSVKIFNKCVVTSFGEPVSNDLKFSHTDATEGFVALFDQGAYPELQRFENE